MSLDSSKVEAENQHLIETFRELRSWVDERLMAKGLQLNSLPQMRGDEIPVVTRADIERLKADLATLIQVEGQRNFWSGFSVNAFFFVLGLIGGIAIDLLKASGLWPF